MSLRLERLGARVAVAAIVAPLLAASCGRRALFVPPVSTGVPAADAQAIWTPIATGCRATTAYRGAFGLTGQVGDRRIRGLASARLNTALSSAGDIGLEATVSGQLVFRLGGNADNAVLLLRDPVRTVAARPDDILESLIGVKVGPERLLAIVAGCVTRDDVVGRAFRHDRLLEIVAGDVTVYLEPAGASWRVRAGRFDDVLVDYGAIVDGTPRDVRIQSAAAGRPAVSLDLRVQVVQTNATLDAALFRVNVPDDAAPISLDELRRTGPLGEDTTTR